MNKYLEKVYLPCGAAYIDLLKGPVEKISSKKKKKKHIQNAKTKIVLFK